LVGNGARMKTRRQYGGNKAGEILWSKHQQLR
jgi:hypothetical protein